MFPDGFDAFWALCTPIWALGDLLAPISLREGFGGLAVWEGVRGEKSPRKKSFGMFLGIRWGCINDVSGCFRHTLGPLDPDLGLWSSVEP